jgi:hypothetical protein
MTREGGQVQLEQSYMHFVLNIAKIAKRWFSCAPVEETIYLSKKPDFNVQEEKNQGIVTPGDPP